MCLLTFYPNGIMPNVEDLTNGGFQNDDGHGYAIVNKTDNRIITGKSLHFDSLLDEFLIMRKLHPNGPAMFHSRIATHGSEEEYNCHPFNYNYQKDTVMGHNGILPIVCQPGKKDPRSDTRILATQFLPKRTHLRFWTKQGKKNLELFIGPLNKLVFLTVNPVYRKDHFIINEKEGIWTSEGIWYSNSSYQPYSYTIIPKQYDWDKWDNDWEKCPHCFSWGTTEYSTRICSFCKMCTDCDDLAVECQCYTPRTLEPKSSQREIIWANGNYNYNYKEGTQNWEKWDNYLATLKRQIAEDLEEYGD